LFDMLHMRCGFRIRSIGAGGSKSVGDRGPPG
jgi:hypothetical protein